MNIKSQATTTKPDNKTKASICSDHPQSRAVIKSMLNRRIQQSIGYNSSITVECEDAVVTLHGYFASAKDKNNALRAAISNPCIRKVVDETQ